ncbi:MAG: hypothetical protein ACI9PP_002155, partial [Halobacteriales archaeon]
MSGKSAEELTGGVLSVIAPQTPEDHREPDPK